jgi:hypothetical protein
LNAAPISIQLKPVKRVTFDIQVELEDIPVEKKMQRKRRRSVEKVVERISALL